MALAILTHTSTSVETEPHTPPEQPAKSPLGERPVPSVSRWGKRDTLLLLLILLLAGGVRILRLAEPNAVVFDETYYAKDACLYLGHSQDFCKVDQATEQSYVHPPLGKWLISLGINAFGYNSFGWRFSAAVFGTAMAGLACVLARKLFKDRWTAAIAGLLTAVDLLLIVQSRIAMLDIFLAFFILLGFLFLVLDRERAFALRMRLAPPLPQAAPAGQTADGPAPSEPAGKTEGSSVLRIKRSWLPKRNKQAAGAPTSGATPHDEALTSHPAGSAASAAFRPDQSTGPMSSTTRLREQPQSAERPGPEEPEAEGPEAERPGGEGPETERPGGERPRGERPEADLPARGVLWRFAAGAAFGLALAVKWSALLALGAAAVCAIFWSLELLVMARKHRSSFYGPPRIALSRELLTTLAAFLLIPSVVYLAAYGAYFVDRQAEDCPYTVPSERERLFDSGLLRQPEGKCITGMAGTLLSFGDLQDRIFDYHSTLQAKHSYQSKAWTWPVMLRPVAYFYETHDGKATEVMALGNVVVWYGALVALIWLVPRCLERWRGERLVLLGWGAQYLPWLLVPRPLFLFYMTPAVPFMMLGLACALAALRRKGRWGRRVVLFYLILAGVTTAMFYPLVAGVPLPQEWWQRLMWIPQFDCGGFMCGWI